MLPVVGPSMSALDFPVHLLNLLCFLTHVGKNSENKECVGVVYVLVILELPVFLDGIHFVRFQYDEVIISPSSMRCEKVGELVPILRQAGLHELDHNLEYIMPSSSREVFPVLLAVGRMVYIRSPTYLV